MNCALGQSLWPSTLLSCRRSVLQTLYLKLYTHSMMVVPLRSVGLPGIGKTDRSTLEVDAYVTAIAEISSAVGTDQYILGLDANVELQGVQDDIYVGDLLS
eukprot:1602837-Amphidinium_carterae.1